jgi:hypothetical protein
MSDTFEQLMEGRLAEKSHAMKETLGAVTELTRATGRIIQDSGYTPYADTLTAEKTNYIRGSIAITDHVSEGHRTTNNDALVTGSVRSDSTTERGKPDHPSGSVKARVLGEKIAPYSPLLPPATKLDEQMQARAQELLKKVCRENGSKV